MGATFSDIIRGTFRISVVAAALAAAYSAYMTWDKYSAAVERHLGLVSTIRCGSHIEEATLKPFENELGLIDLSKTGCSDRRFSPCTKNSTRFGTVKWGYSLHTHHPHLAQQKCLFMRFSPSSR